MVKKIKIEDYKDKVPGFGQLSAKQKKEMQVWLDGVMSRDETQNIDQKNKRRIKIWIGIIIFVVVLMVMIG